MKPNTSFKRPLQRFLAASLIAASLLLLATGVEAGPKGTVNVRPLGNKRLTIDGNIADWPLSAFTTVSQQPLFPDGQNATSTTANGDHLVFDNKRIGLFNATAEDGFTADGINDFGATTYFAYDRKFLYVLCVVIDQNLRDDLDTTDFGSSGFLNDGFEFFIDAKGDSTDCISDDAFPNIDGPDSSSPNTDDFQVTVALNTKFKPAGSGANILGARQGITRSGTVAMQGPLDENGAVVAATMNGPGGTYRDSLTAATTADGSPDIAAMKYDDLRAAGALNPEILANPTVKFSGYAIEMRVPLQGKILADLRSERARVAGSEQVVQPATMGFDLFWRDVDEDGTIKWGDWAQSTTVDCGVPQTSLFNTANWGQLVFDYAHPLVPFAANTPKILFLASDASNPPNADADLMNFFEANGYQAILFHSSGYATQPGEMRAATAGKVLVFISESIGSTSITDPVGQATGAFALHDTDIPIISFEAFMFDNAGWVKLGATWATDGANDFIGWGNTARAEVYDLGTDPGPQDSLYILKPTHPMANGLTGKVKVYTKPYSFNFGLPSAEADIVASVNADGTYPTLFVYDKGKKLSDGTVAPNKRIALFLGQTGTGKDLPDGTRSPEANFPTDFTILSPDGQKLLLNTLAYASGLTTATGQPAELGQTVNGFQDDFTSATRDPNWVPVGPSGDTYTQVNGVLQVAAAHGDPNHLLYKGAGGSNIVQEVLARMRVVGFGTLDYVRGGVCVGALTNVSGAPATNWAAFNLHFRDVVEDNAPARHFRLLDDNRAWGPHLDQGWTNNVWYWLRLKIDGTNNPVVGKVWLADGQTPEPANWQMSWTGRPVHPGYVGITGGSGEPTVDRLAQTEIDYILIKSPSLPSITANFAAQGPSSNPPLIYSASKQGSNFVIDWFGGALQTAAALNNSWTNSISGPSTARSATASPATNALSAAPMNFYRIRQ
jgi:hypothetical protein